MHRLRLGAAVRRAVPVTERAQLPAEQRFWQHFRLLWLGQLLSAVGDRLHSVALVWIAVQAASSGAGWVLAAGAAGRLVFGLIGGAYADRLDRQRLIIACDLSCVAAVLLLVGVDLGGPFALWWLAGVSFVVGTLDAFTQPALQASLPVLAPDRASLQRANEWLNVNRRLAMALGPAVTGVLLAAIPLVQFFALDALTFVASAIAVRALGRGDAWAPQTSGQRKSLWLEISAGMRAAWAHRLLSWGIAQAGLWNLVLTPALSLGAALLVHDELHAGPEWLGYVMAAYGVGNVAANLVVARLDALPTGRTLFAGATVAAAGWMLFAVTTNVWLLLIVTALTANGGPMADLMLLRMIQNDFAVQQVGRVFSMRSTLSRTAGALGMLLAVFWYAVLGPRWAIGTGGALLLGFALVGWWLVGRSHDAAAMSARS